MFRGSLNSSNMIVSDRRLVCLWTGSLVRVWGVLIRWCRQWEPAKPAIRIERFSNSILNVKKYLHIRQLSFSGLAGFVAAFFPFFRDYFAICRKISSCTFLSFLSHFFCSYQIVLEISEGAKLKKKQLVWGLLFLVTFFLPGSASDSTAKTTPNSHKWASSQTGLSFITR